jgi:hypothetical protein
MNLNMAELCLNCPSADDADIRLGMCQYLSLEQLKIVIYKNSESEFISCDKLKTLSKANMAELCPNDLSAYDADIRLGI